MNKLQISVLGLLCLLSGEILGQTNVFPASGDVGVGTVSPLTTFHVMKEDTGIKSQYSMSMLEAADAQLDIVSSSGGTWGSAINFIEGNGVSNTNVWSLARQTTAGSGDSSLRINYGVNNRHDNVSLVTFKSDGNMGIGTVTPTHKLSVYGNASVQDFLVIQKGGSYRIALNGTNDAYINGRNSAFENKFSISSNGNSYFNGGNVGVGTASPDSKLTVKGNIHAEEVKVDLSVPGPDYVFKEGYDLKSLEEVQDYINEHGHLPNVPSAKEMEANGVQLGEMNMKLLEKIEELTLYAVEQEEKLKEMTVLKRKVDQQEKRLKKLEQLLNEK